MHRRADRPVPLGMPLPAPVPPHEATVPGDGFACDVAVVGAGVIGLSIGWRLAARGLRVAVLDRGRAGGGASLAATGMLAAAAEFEPGGKALVPLALESQRLWPAFRTELEAAAGMSIDYRDEGTLLVAIGREERERARFRFELARRAGVNVEWLDAVAARRREPGLHPAVVGGLWCPDDHQVDPRRLIAALCVALRESGGTLAEGCNVTAIETHGGRVAGVRASSGLIQAPHVVLATGVWTATDGLVAGLDIPMRPLKGQSLALRAPANQLPRHVVWSGQVHLAPKSDGHVIVGATVEEQGFDDALTAGGVYALLEGARRVLPATEEMEVAAIWSGWRPTTDDDAPVIGSGPLEGLALATGHHRNGYLLAPVTAGAVEALVVSGALPSVAEPFRTDRFASVRREAVQGGIS